MRKRSLREMFPEMRQAMQKKIFCIGLNKCGTTTLHKFFLANGISSAHWQSAEKSQDWTRNSIARRLLANISAGRNVLAGMDRYIAYSDMTYLDASFYIEGSLFLERIVEQYPDSYYILNVRNEDRWIESRMNHSDFAERARRALECSLQELEVIWREQFRQHRERALRHLQGKRLLVFDIEKDDPQRIVDFLRKDYSLERKFWCIQNRTAR